MPRLKTDGPPRPPWAALVETLRGDLSKREAARRCGLTDPYWGSLERGYKKRGETWEPLRPSEGTVLQIAKGLALPEQDMNDLLIACGFDPWIRRFGRDGPGVTSTAEAIALDPALSEEAKRSLLYMYQTAVRTRVVRPDPLGGRSRHSGAQPATPT